MVAAAQQHAPGSNQASALGHHAGWSPTGVGPMASANGAHHAVVTDHSTLAYMTHYQNHGSPSVTDHHRNSSGPLASQPIGTAAQSSTYTVDTLYSAPAAAAAAAAVAAAYGYNDYGAAFFQTSNNGAHTQTGHPSSAGLSAFWNQTTQHQQPRTTHSQTVSSQNNSMQQRQHQLNSEQSANNYLHDPRLYAYNRSPYTQNETQNFGVQHQVELQQQPQHHQQRMSANLSHQHSLINQHQHDNQHQLVPQHMGAQTVNHVSTSQPAQQSSSLVSSQHHSELDNKKTQSNLRVSPQQQIQKQQTNIEHSAARVDLELKSSNQPPPAQQRIVTQKINVSGDELDAKIDPHASKEQMSRRSPNQPPSTNNSIASNRTPSVIKTDVQSGQYQARKSSVTNARPQPPIHQSSHGVRNTYRNSQEERVKPQLPDDPMKKFPSEQKDTRSVRDPDSSSKPSQSVTSTNRPQEALTDQSTSLDEDLAALAISSRKTTWASIASQPAKLSQPKSLKSKITGSNSVLSSTNKHLTTSVSIDSSSLDSKNGINPAIKSSVSTAATSLSRPAPPPVSKIVSATAASLKLDLLGEGGLDSKISWPAVNASINLNLDDTTPQKSTNTENHVTNSSNNSDTFRDDGYKNRDMGRDMRDHNHNQGLASKFSSMHQQRDDRRQDDWHRRDQRDFRTRRDSDRRLDDMGKRSPIGQHEDLRDHLNAKRDFKNSNRIIPNQLRNDEPPYRNREFKRAGSMLDREDPRGHEDYRATSREVYDQPGREGHPLGNSMAVGNRQFNDMTSHHHYNNLKGVNQIRNQKPANKVDLLVNPHLNPENFNPKNFNLEPENARYFIIKSYSEDDIHRSVKYSVWCSTKHGNERLDEAYRQQQATNGKIFLFFSVNGSGHFCGMAQMTSSVDFDSSSNIWAQSKWQGQFNVKWIYVKDVPNHALRHITLENNENKPVTNSRDTQEVPSEKGRAVLKIIHQYLHKTSLFDDFPHYEQRQEEERAKKTSQSNHQASGALPARNYDRDDRMGGVNGGGSGGGGAGGRFGRPYMNSRPHNSFQGRERQPRYA